MESYSTLGLWLALGCCRHEDHELEEFCPLENKKILHLSKWSMQVLGSNAKIIFISLAEGFITQLCKFHQGEHPDTASSQSGSTQHANSYTISFVLVIRHM